MDEVVKIGFALFFGLVIFCGICYTTVSCSLRQKFRETIDGVSFEMVYVKGGTFMMGATKEQESDANYAEYPLHQVTLLDYYIGKFEVTQGLWEKVMGTTIEQQRDKAWEDWQIECKLYGEGPDYPMYYVSWNEAQEFCTKLSQLTGKKYALPAEAQWEYAARGGVLGKKYKYSGGNNINKVGWYSENSNNSIHPVGQKQPNALGLYDMSGNVWEWCSDWYGPYSSESQTNPIGPATGSYRVLRGGSWGNYYARNCRVAFRYNGFPSVRSNHFGFRVVLLP